MHILLTAAVFTEFAFTQSSSASTRNRLLTLFPEEMVSWNQAAEICESISSTLLRLDSDDTRRAVRKLKSSVWSLHWQENFWVGLHNVAETQPPNYMWQGTCEMLGEYRPWNDEEQPFVKRCVYGMESLQMDYFLETAECYVPLGVAMCEKFAGTCSFDEFEGETVTPGGDDGDEDLFEVNSETECQQLCLNYEGPLECWGVTFQEMNNNACHLHYDTSRQSIKERRIPSNNPNTELFLKMCFSGETNFADFRRRYRHSSDDSVPHKGCWGIKPPTTSISPDTELLTTSSPATTTENINVPSHTSSSSISTQAESLSTLHQGTGTTSLQIVTTLDTVSSQDIRSTVTVIQTLSVSPAATTNATVFDSSVQNTTPVVTSASEVSGQTSPLTYVDIGASDVTTADELTTITEQAYSTSHRVASPCCACSRRVVLTEEEKDIFISKLLHALSPKKSQFSSHRRRYNSAEDIRMSVKVMGVLGISLVVLCFCLIVLLDIRNLFNDIKLIHLWYST